MWQRYKGQQKYFNRSFPELIDLPEGIRLRLIKDFKRCVYKSPRFWMTMIPVPILIVASVYLEDHFFQNNSLAQWISFIIRLLVIVGVVFVGGILIKPIRRRWLYREVNKLGFRPKGCLLCGYDLRGTPDTSTACPECGAQIAAVMRATPDADNAN